MVYTIRLTEEMIQALDELSQITCSNRSIQIKVAVKQYLENNKDKLKPDTVKLLEEIDRKHRLSKNSTLLREENRANYIIKNAYKTILDITFWLYFNSNRINIKVVKSILKRYNNIFECFTDEQKENLKDEITQLNKLTDVEYLRKKLNNPKYIQFQMKKQIEEITKK